MAGEDDIPEIIQKYMDILGCPGDGPIVEVRNNLGSKWLGICRFHSSNPDTTTITVQQSIVDHARTLERVIAHEMIHHYDFMTMPKHELALLKLGRRSLADGHGARFLELAAVVNDAVGDDDFVTVKSDSEYEVTGNEKPFFVLIDEPMRGRLGWAWAARLSEKAKGVVADMQTRGAVLATTTDGRFTSGVKIARNGGRSIPPKGGEMEKALRELYEEVTGDR